MQRRVVLDEELEGEEDDDEIEEVEGDEEEEGKNCCFVLRWQIRKNDQMMA